MDPASHVPLQQPEWNCSRVKDNLVEVAEVEARSERSFYLAPELPHLELADLVGNRLAGPCNIAVDLVDYVVLVFRGVLQEVIDGFLTVPLKGMDSGIDHQADG